MAYAWIWAQMANSEPGRVPTFSPPLIPWQDAQGGSRTIIKLGAVPDPNTGAPLNQFCLCCVDSSMTGAAWADLPPLDQAIWLYAASEHPDDADLAAAIPAGATQPTLSAEDAVGFANATTWLDIVNAPVTTTGAP